MRLTVLMFVCFAAVMAEPANRASERFWGGPHLPIEQYPFAAAMLRSWPPLPHIFLSEAAGTIINNRSILTTAAIFEGHSSPAAWQFRVGTNHANFIGTIYQVSQVIMHPDYHWRDRDNNIGIARTDTQIVYSPSVQPASIAGPNYNVPDSSSVWAVGFDHEIPMLSHLELWKVNTASCRTTYVSLDRAITDNMLCAAEPLRGGNHLCSVLSGIPLVHGGVVVGVFNYAMCDSFTGPVSDYPAVFMSVSRYTAWIQSNA